MSDIEHITTTQALLILRNRGTPKTLPTIIRWITEQNLGYKIAGEYSIYKQKFMDFIDGKDLSSTDRG